MNNDSAARDADDFGPARNWSLVKRLQSLEDGVIHEQKVILERVSEVFGLTVVEDGDTVIVATADGFTIVEQNESGVSVAIGS